MSYPLLQLRPEEHHSVCAAPETRSHKPALSHRKRLSAGKQEPAVSSRLSTDVLLSYRMSPSWGSSSELLSQKHPLTAVWEQVISRTFQDWGFVPTLDLRGPTHLQRTRRGPSGIKAGKQLLLC